MTEGVAHLLLFGVFRRNWGDQLDITTIRCLRLRGNNLHLDPSIHFYAIPYLFVFTSSHKYAFRKDLHIDLSILLKHRPIYASVQTLVFCAAILLSTVPTYRAFLKNHAVQTSREGLSLCLLCGFVYLLDDNLDVSALDRHAVVALPLQELGL